MSQEQLSSTQVPRPRTVAIVTGASRGLGQAFAHQLATQCTHLITIARQAEADKSTAELAAQHGCEVGKIAFVQSGDGRFFVFYSGEIHF